MVGGGTPRRVFQTALRELTLCHHFPRFWNTKENTPFKISDQVQEQSSQLLQAKYLKAGAPFQMFPTNWCRLLAFTGKESKRLGHLSSPKRAQGYVWVNKSFAQISS